MHIQLKRQIFRSGKRKSRRRYPFNCGVIRKIDKHNRTLNSTGLVQVVDEELGRFKRNPHCRKYNCKLLRLLSQNRCLPG